MFSISAFILVAALSSALVHAQVDPSEPSPGSVYPEGGQCPIVWGGDPSKTNTWKNMNIQLMTGDNFNMIPLTTVATGQDGTVDGKFSYPCPVVTLHAPVYFYQFTNGQTSDKQWTTRFTISTASGATTPAPNATQPGTGDAIPWGVGALANPSQAVPPPGSSAAGAVSNPPSSSGVLIASTSSGGPLSPPSSTASPIVAVPPSSSPSGIVTSVVGASPSATPSATGTGSSGAIALSATSAMTSLIIPILALILF
ncbi:hypothetical protein NP233_g367 [Leucocoprinus birnbaumii]|uniref:Yeast cell wall synthesis Kre9/Knh1-like N-terminal domain-containing protein n=1 Tax=Leucocoprinus birnbaumii TaxID=56174 RepID=A0AAD5YVU7_9AGAR|nr:hypothetical protein NP233_g367 [Leucocoprinus birnbaumii]